MKVNVVVKGVEYEDSKNIEGIFTSQELAITFCEKFVKENGKHLPIYMRDVWYKKNNFLCWESRGQYLTIEEHDVISKLEVEQDVK